MSAHEVCNGRGDAVLQPFADFWADYVNRANDMTREMLNGFQENADLKSWQRRWYEAVSKSMDAYMRSPGFLKAMKQNTDAAIKMKLHSDDLANEVARNLNIPMATDISGLFERLHSVEEAILERLGCIEERLEAIEERTVASQGKAPLTDH
jgi:hypothetical protein